MDTYEVAVLYHPDLEIDLDKGASKVKKIITDAGGKIASEDVWGKRKLAYQIGSAEHAIYAFYDVEMAGEAIAKIESNLNISEEVIRFLITKPDVKAQAKAKAAKAQRKRTEQDDEEKKDNEQDDK